MISLNSHPLVPQTYPNYAFTAEKNEKKCDIDCRARTY